MPKYVTQEHFDATIQGFRDEMLTKLDAIMTTVVRLDQVRLVGVDRISRIEADVLMMKKHLKLA